MLTSEPRLRAQVTQEKSRSWTFIPRQESKKQQEAPQEARAVLLLSWSSHQEKERERRNKCHARSCQARGPLCQESWRPTRRGRRRTRAIVMPRGVSDSRKLDSTGWDSNKITAASNRVSHRESDCGYANNYAYDESGITKSSWLT